MLEVMEAIRQVRAIFDLCDFTASQLVLEGLFFSQILAHPYLFVKYLKSSFCLHPYNTIMSLLVQDDYTKDMVQRETNV